MYQLVGVAAMNPFRWMRQRLLHAVGAVERRWVARFLIENVCTAGIAGLVVALVALYISLHELNISRASYEALVQELKSKSCPTFVDGLAKVIEQFYVSEFKDGAVVQRKKLNNTLADTLDQAELVVLLGQRQAGKSVLLQSFLNGKKNVYHYAPSDGRKLGDDEEKVCGSVFFNKQTLVKVLRKVPKSKAEPAYVAFEINHDTQSNAVTSVYEALKNIIFDSHLDTLVKGLLVLSNSYAIESFPADHGRYETIWVGDLTEDEAKQFIRAKRQKNDVEQYIEGLNATGLHVRQLETALRAVSLEAWKERVVTEVQSAADVKNTRKVMHRLPREGAAWHELNISLNGPDVIEFVRGDTRRVVVYNAGLRLIHWASPQHHEVWNKRVAHEYRRGRAEL